MTKSVETDEIEEQINRKEIEIGSYNNHLQTVKKGLEEYKIWHNLTWAVVHMAYPNTYHRIDLRDKETLKRLEKDLDRKIDYEYIESEIARKPFLVQPNGQREPLNKEIGFDGRPLTKKQLKVVAKKEKLQGKVDKLQQKYDNIKNKKCDRALKLKTQIEEMEKARDRAT